MLDAKLVEPFDRLLRLRTHLVSDRDYTRNPLCRPNEDDRLPLSLEVCNRVAFEVVVRAVVTGLSLEGDAAVGCNVDVVEGDS